MHHSLICAPEPLGIPLCRSYVAVFFSVISVQVDGESGLRPEQMLWAVGVLSDGLPDYLGSWHMPESTAPWHQIADELKARGVERIRLVITPDPTDMPAALTAQFHGSTCLPNSHPMLSQAAIDSLLPGHRPYAVRAQEVSTHLSRRLHRAVSRHGTFQSPTAAEAFLSQSAKRFIHANWPEPPAQPLSVRHKIARPEAVDVAI